MTISPHCWSQASTLVVSTRHAFHWKITRRSLITAILISFALTACSFGPQRLASDPVDYARALSDAKKRQTLSIIVGLRYADAPGFLTISQIIAAYTLDANGTAVVNSAPDPGGPRAGITAMAGFSHRPTFTFLPTTGQQFTEAYIHPLPPTSVLPLANSGIPVDLLLRLTLQSIGGLHNATMLAGSSAGGSPEFFILLQALRRLQLDGLLTIRFKSGDPSQGVTLLLPPSSGVGGSQDKEDLSITRRLLHLANAQTAFDIVDEATSHTPEQAVAISTRSVLAILSDLGAEIDVPAEDIRRGKTKPSIDLVGGESRAVIVIHSGPRSPADAYATVKTAGSVFWIDGADFDSKYAMTLVEYLIAISEVTDRTHAPLVTIPAN